MFRQLTKLLDSWGLSPLILSHASVGRYLRRYYRCYLPAGSRGRPIGCCAREPKSPVKRSPKLQRGAKKEYFYPNSASSYLAECGLLGKSQQYWEVRP